MDEIRRGIWEFLMERTKSRTIEDEKVGLILVNSIILEYVFL
jgi:hypothetical protein